MMTSSSHTTRRPGSEVSATSARHSRVKSSTTRRPGPEFPFAPAAPANLQPFLAIETTKLLMVHDKSLTAHQHKQAAILAVAAPALLLPQNPDDLLFRE